MGTVRHWGAEEPAPDVSENQYRVKSVFFADFIPERTGHVSLVPRAVLFFRLTAFFSRDPV